MLNAQRMFGLECATVKAACKHGPSEGSGAKFSHRAVTLGRQGYFGELLQFLRIRIHPQAIEDHSILDNRRLDS